MKKLAYHINPILNKKEEELHLKNMQKKILAAKSSLPPGAKSGAKKKSVVGMSKQPAALGNISKGALQDEDEDELRQIDGMIMERLHDILGEPLIQRIRGLSANSAGSKKTQNKAVKGGSNGRLPAAGPKRPAWNEDWNSQGQTPPAPWPGSESHAVRNAPPSRGRVQSAGQAKSNLTPPRKNRAPFSAQPVNRAPVPDPSNGPKVQLLGLQSPAAYSGRPTSGLRYALNSQGQQGQNHQWAPSALTNSDHLAIAVLNPQSATHQRPPPGPPSSGGPFKSDYTDHTSKLSSAATLPDSNMMSLSRLSLVQGSRGPAPRSQGHMSGLTPAVGISTNHRHDLPDVVGVPVGNTAEGEECSQEDQDEYDDYEDDFEEEQEEEPEVGVRGTRPLDAGALRQSVALLNSLVQLKINKLTEKLDDEFEMCLGDEFCQRVHHESEGEGAEEDLMDGTLDQEAWEREDRALLRHEGNLHQTHDLMGGEMDHSSLLLPGVGDAGDLLHESDLDYLDRLGGNLKLEEEVEAEAWGCSQDGDVIEAAAPVGNTLAWGSGNPSSQTKEVSHQSATERLQQLKQRRHQQHLQQLQLEQQQQQQNQPEQISDKSLNNDLQEETKALYKSLRQLHELMTGPRGKDLSPRGLDPSQSGGFILNERSSLVGPTTVYEEDYIPEATVGERVLDINCGTEEPSSETQGLTSLAVQMTPKSALCAGDVEWMASLMHNLSASLGVEAGEMHRKLANTGSFR